MDYNMDIFKDGRLFDYGKYGADFFGYDVAFSSSIAVKKRLNGRTYHVRNEYPPHVCKITFLVKSMEQAMMLVNLLTSFTACFSDSPFTHYLVVSAESEIEYVGYETYLLVMTFDDDVCKPKRIINFKGNKTIVLESYRPSPLKLTIQPISDIKDYRIEIFSLDDVKGKVKTNTILIKTLLGGSSLVIDSSNFTIKKGNDNYSMNVELVEFPILLGKVTFRPQDANVKIKVEVEERV